MTWKFIPGYEGMYTITSNGQIKSVKFETVRMLKQPTDTHGYPQVNLYKNKKRKNFLVHRLVLETFRGAKREGEECRHLDGNINNNDINNLSWGTHSENMIDRNTHGTTPNTRGSRNNKAKLNELQVRVIRKLLNTSGLTQKEIAKIFGVTSETVCSINTRKTWV